MNRVSGVTLKRFLAKCIAIDAAASAITIRLYLIACLSASDRDSKGF